MKFLRVLALCLPVVFIGGTASAGVLQDIQTKHVLKVATDLGNPPFGFKNAHLESDGYDVAVAKLLAKDLGAKLDLVATTQPNRIPFLITHKVDIVISTLAVTPDRQKVIDFTHPYAVVLNVVAAPNSMAISGPGDLAGKRIAVTRGTTNDTALTGVAPKNATIVRFDDEATTVTALTSGQLDIVADNPDMVRTINGKKPSLELEPKFTLRQISFAIGVRKGDDELRGWLNKWIAANLQNGRLNALFQQYTGAALPSDLASQSR